MSDPALEYLDSLDPFRPIFGHLPDVLGYGLPLQSCSSDPSASRTIPLRTSSSPKLLPEILPYVVRHLDSQDDLSTLLNVQRVSKHGWDLATPLVYQDITVRNWYSLLRTPRGLLPSKQGKDETSNDCSYCSIVMAPTHLEGMRRRRKAFGFTRKMTVNIFPTQYAVAMYNVCAGHERSCRYYDLTDPPRDIAFPNVEESRIRKEAMLPYIPGGKYEPYGLGLDSEAHPWKHTGMHVAYPLTLKMLVRPKRTCLRMPLVWDEMSINSGPLFVHQDDEGRLDTGLRRALITLLLSQQPGAQMTIHDFADRLLYLTTIRSLQYHLFYPGTSADQFVQRRKMQRSLDNRMGSYLQLLMRTRRSHNEDLAELRTQQQEVSCADNLISNALQSQPEGDSSAASSAPTLPIATWRISGESGLHGSCTEIQSQIESTVLQITDVIQREESEYRRGEDLRIVSKANDHGVERLMFEMAGRNGSCEMCGLA